MSTDEKEDHFHGREAERVFPLCRKAFLFSENVRVQERTDT